MTATYKPDDGHPYRLGEVWVAEITAHHPPGDEPDPDPMMGRYHFPRHYDWEDPTGRFVQPPLVWAGKLEIDPGPPEVTLCVNEMSIRPGRARNVAEMFYDAFTTPKPVPVGTPVLMGLGYLPQLADPSNCNGFVQQSERLAPPYIFFNLPVDPWSAYCFCNPDPGGDPGCPPHAEP